MLVSGTVRSNRGLRSQSWLTKIRVASALFTSRNSLALDTMDVSVAMYRDFDKAPGEVSLYDAVNVMFEMWGVSDDDAKFLVKTWKQR